MDTLQLKILAGFMFLISALFFGLTPFILIRSIWSGTNRSVGLLTQHLHALAAGVLLATCLLHLLPESVQAVNRAVAVTSERENQPISDETNTSKAQSNSNCEQVSGNNVIDNDGLYPIAELMVALGFLFIHCLDSIIKSWQAIKNHEEVEEAELDNAMGWTGDRQLLAHDHFREQASDRTKLLMKSVSESENGHFTENKINPCDENSTDEEESLRQISRCSRVPSNSKDISESGEAHPLAEQQHLDKLKNFKSTGPRVRSIALVAALCIHGFFDGVLLGLQTSEGVLLTLMLALTLHKSFVAVSLSLTLSNNYQAKDKKKTPIYSIEILYIFLFSCTAPLGLAVSSVFVHTAFDLTMGDSAGDGSVSALPGCLQAFAVGTFIYVTFSELTEHSKHQNVFSNERRRKLLIRTLIDHAFLLFGFSLMAGLRAALDN
ncbi:hypothetical protein RRG08_051032 [Elysia crispata]|uniref:Uncharacterized protein n=1 Tax=Elysia crispata TaxID=231223 RepID=A0AAE0Z503_9GAST|nr:hypothetical protein RRG08_051032 [Elysia crispata]